MVSRLAQIPRRSGRPQRVPNALHLQHGFVPPTLVWWLSPLLVGGTTSIVFWLQVHLTNVDGHQYIRPYGIALLIPVMILTIWGGRMIGWLTLALAVLSYNYVLEQPRFVWSISTTRSGIELLFLAVVGALAVLSVEARRQRFEALEDVTATPRARAVTEEIQQIAGQISGVSRLGDCLVYQRGLDIYLHLDILVEDALSLSQARVVASDVESALVQKMPLLFKVYVHLA